MLGPLDLTCRLILKGKIKVPKLKSQQSFGARMKARVTAATPQLTLRRISATTCVARQTLSRSSSRRSLEKALSNMSGTLMAAGVGLVHAATNTESGAMVGEAEGGLRRRFRRRSSLTKLFSDMDRQPKLSKHDITDANYAK
eukprot:1208283-Prymnesium_polylepis.1